MIRIIFIGNSGWALNEFKYESDEELTYSQVVVTLNFYYTFERCVSVKNIKTGSQNEERTDLVQTRIMCSIKYRLYY